MWAELTSLVVGILSGNASDGLGRRVVFRSLCELAMSWSTEQIDTWEYPDVAAVASKMLFGYSM